jgi:hypothetical protein
MAGHNLNLEFDLLPGAEEDSAVARKPMKTSELYHARLAVMGIVIAAVGAAGRRTQ